MKHEKKRWGCTSACPGSAGSPQISSFASQDWGGGGKPLNAIAALATQTLIVCVMKQSPSPIRLIDRQGPWGATALAKGIFNFHTHTHTNAHPLPTLFPLQLVDLFPLSCSKPSCPWWIMPIAPRRTGGAGASGRAWCVPVETSEPVAT